VFLSGTDLTFDFIFQGLSELVLCLPSQGSFVSETDDFGWTPKFLSVFISANKSPPNSGAMRFLSLTGSLFVKI